MALSENIRRLREEHNLTQQQLADRLYVSRQTICRWENGSRCPDLIAAKQLAMELGISLDALISDEDMKESMADNELPGMNMMRKRSKLFEKKKKIETVWSTLGLILFFSNFVWSIRFEEHLPFGIMIPLILAVSVGIGVWFRIIREINQL